MRRISKINVEKAKTISMRSFVAILGIAFGVLITAQWNSVPPRVTNPVAPYTSLKDTKNELYQEQTQLKAEIKNLQTSIEQTQQSGENISLSKSQIEDLNQKKAQAGLTKLNGPGIIINLDDSPASPATEDSIVHAADIRDILNLLWGGGAEAISVNGQRVVINTAVDCIVNTILINNERLSTPFRIEAIGSESNLYDLLTDQNVLSDLHKRVRSEGVVLSVSKNNDITVPVFDGSFETKNGESQ